MSASRELQPGAGAVRITRSEAIAKLKELRRNAAASRFGNGQIFSAKWVCVGDEKISPYVCHKALRFQVTGHLKGGERSFDAEEQGYMGVYEMANRKRALKLYKGAAEHRLEELRPQLAAAQQAADAASIAVPALEQAATAAAAALTAAEQLEYKTKKARQEAEGPLKKSKKDADRDLKKADEGVEKTNRKLQTLRDKVADEELKISDHIAALTATINERIGRFTEKLAAESDTDEKAALEARIALERELLADPVKSLMARYRLLNVNGLISLKVQGQEFEITTRPVPAIPEQDVTVDSDEDAETAGALIAE